MERFHVRTAEVNFTFQRLSFRLAMQTEHFKIKRVMESEDFRTNKVS